jgi:porin
MAWAKLYPTADRSVALAAGAYAVNPTIVNTHDGFQLGLDNVTGTYIPVEFGWRRGQSDDKGPLPGMYRAAATTTRRR